MALSEPRGWVHPEDLRVIIKFIDYLNENHPVGSDSPLWYSTGRIEIVSPEARTLLGYAQAHDDLWGFVPVFNIGFNPA